MNLMGHEDATTITWYIHKFFIWMATIFKALKWNRLYDAAMKAAGEFTHDEEPWAED